MHTGVAKREKQKTEYKKLKNYSDGRRDNLNDDIDWEKWQNNDSIILVRITESNIFASSIFFTNFFSLLGYLT